MVFLSFICLIGIIGALKMFAIPDYATAFAFFACMIFLMLWAIKQEIVNNKIL